MKLKYLLLAAAVSIGIGAQAKEKAGNILVAYFSWGGNTEHVAKFIAEKPAERSSASLPRSPTLPNTHPARRWQRPRRSRTRALP